VGDAVALGNIFGAPIEEVRFAADSPLEEAVTSEPVSGKRPEILLPAGKNKTHGFAIEFAGKRDSFRWLRALWHFIPAYNALARARQPAPVQPH